MYSACTRFDLVHFSAKLNLLRVFIRLSKDVKAIDMKRYVALEEAVDEIGRMLGRAFHCP